MSDSPMRRAWYTSAVRRPLLLFAVVAIVLSGVALVGCSGGGDAKDANDPTANLTGPQILERALEASRGAESFQVSLVAAIQGTPRVGGTPAALEALIAQPVDVSVTGRARRPNAMSMDAKIESQALPLETTLIQKGGGLYLDVVGQAFKLVRACP